MQLEKALTKKQIDFVRHGNHRWNFKGGATRSGKTYLDFRWIIPMRIRERVGKDGLAVILGVTKSTIERNVLAPMRDIYGEELVGPISSDNTARIFGERCYCLGAEKVSQVSKLRGSSIKYAYGDEVADWAEEVFELLKSRLDKPYSVFDGTYNPKGPNHWLKAFIESDADIFDQRYTIFDNPFLPKEFVDNLCKEYAGTVYYGRYILGEWTLAEGLVYPVFANSPESYILDDVEKWIEETGKQFTVRTIGVDFGGTGSATKFQVTGITRDGCVVALDEEYIDHRKESIDPDRLNKRYAAFVERVTENWGNGRTYADSAEQILIRGFSNTARAQGLQTTVLNAKKMPINDRIKLTLLLMAQGRFFVTRKCPHLIDALSTAVYDSTKQNDERLDNGTTDIDSLDAFEYSIEPWYKPLESAGHIVKKAED